jgi:UDP-GlcNAc:undecaprenyl-phosphate GlcNAc-1-phosphate transferase
MRLGHGQRRAVVILWTWTALLSGAVLVPVYTGNGLGLMPLAVAALGLLLFTLFAPVWEVRRANASRVGVEDHAPAAGPPAQLAPHPGERAAR